MAMISLLTGAAFNPETVKLLMTAFDTAWAQAQKSDSTIALDSRASAAREILAMKIIQSAKLDERDIGHLVKGALEHLSNSKTVIWTPPPGTKVKKSEERL